MKKKAIEAYKKKQDYNNKFNKQTYKQFIIRVNKKNETLINWIESQENKNAYFLQLIESDMKKNS